MCNWSVGFMEEQNPTLPVNTIGKVFGKFG